MFGSSFFLNPTSTRLLLLSASLGLACGEHTEDPSPTPSPEPPAEEENAPETDENTSTEESTESGEEAQHVDVTFDCVTGHVICADRCSSLFNDPENCGACGNVCSGDEICHQGACRIPCTADTTDCDGTCVDTSLNPAHCGSCGTVCPRASPYCVLGECSSTE